MKWSKKELENMTSAVQFIQKGMSMIPAKASKLYSALDTTLFNGLDHLGLEQDDDEEIVKEAI